MRTQTFMLMLGLAIASSSIAADLDTPGDIADQAFVTQAVSTGLAEVSLAKMAQTRSGNVKIKDLGAMIERDHAASNQALVKLADAKEIALPDSASSAQDQRESQFESMLPAEFDRRYLDATIDDHLQSLRLYQQEIDTGKDAELRGFASRTLPLLQQHLETAKALRAAAQ